MPSVLVTNAATSAGLCGRETAGTGGTACAGGRSALCRGSVHRLHDGDGMRHSWYHGPRELKRKTKRAIRTARFEFNRVYGLDLKFDFKKHSIFIHELPAERVVQMSQTGFPLVDVDGNGTLEYGTIALGNVFIPRGSSWGTHIHEMGHLLLWLHGMGGTNADHDKYPWFFRRHTGNRLGPRLWK